MLDNSFISDIRHKFLKVQQYAHYTRVNGMGQRHKYRLMLNSRLIIFRFRLIFLIRCKFGVFENIKTYDVNIQNKPNIPFSFLCKFC